MIREEALFAVRMDRRFRAQSPAPMRAQRFPSGDPTSLGRFLPAWHFREVHSTLVSAPRGRVYRAVLGVTPEEIFLFRALVAIRRLGRRIPEGILNPPPGEPLLASATRTQFRVLEERPPEEIAIGTLLVSPGRRGATPPASPLEFEAARLRSGVALAAMNFRLTEAAGRTLLVTETRVFAPDRGVRRRFALYWLAIRAGSGLIRRMWLRAIRRRAEDGR
jgi:hypothetical protein